MIKFSPEFLERINIKANNNNIPPLLLISSIYTVSEKLVDNTLMERPDVSIRDLVCNFAMFAYKKQKHLSSGYDRALSDSELKHAASFDIYGVLSHISGTEPITHFHSLIFSEAMGVFSELNKNNIDLIGIIFNDCQEEIQEMKALIRQA